MCRPGPGQDRHRGSSCRPDLVATTPGCVPFRHVKDCLPFSRGRCPGPGPSGGGCRRDHAPECRDHAPEPYVSTVAGGHNTAVAEHQPSGGVVQYPSTDRCFHLQLAAPFLMQATPGRSVPWPGLPGAAAQGACAVPGSADSDLPGNPMNIDEHNGADTSPAGAYSGRVRLLADTLPRL